MKYLAIINPNNNIVTNIIICNDDFNLDNSLDITELYLGDAPPCIGDTYENGWFYPPQPYPSWTKGTDGFWVCPKPYPEDWNKGKARCQTPTKVWNEDQLEWIDRY